MTRPEIDIGKARAVLTLVNSKARNDIMAAACEALVYGRGEAKLADGSALVIEFVTSATPDPPPTA